MDRKRILLVDDNLDDVELTLRAFRKVGLPCEIQVAHDGVEALDYLLGVSGSLSMPDTPLPHLVLLDLNLPRMHGLDVLRSLRAHARTQLVPVVVLSSSREHADLRQSYMNGANSYIRKPIDFDEFMATVHSLGMYWLIMNEIPPEE